MASQRRRDPPRPRAVCLHCGWSGTPNHRYLRDDFGDASIILSQKPCPRCGRAVTQLEPPPPVPIALIRAVREAKLAPNELLRIADAVRAAPDGLTPRELAVHLPAASKLITIASRVGEKWAELLVIAVTLVALYVQAAGTESAHQDATQSHRDAAQAHEDAERTHNDAVRALRSTAELSDADIHTLADKVAAEFQKHRDDDGHPRP
jgi:hypothetical protein